MAGLCWMAVTLAFFLSAENTLAVDQNRLAEFVNGTLDKYGPEGMFSLAVSIPEDQKRRPMDILKEVYESDPSNKVLEKLKNNEVYIGSRVVAAKGLKQARGADHAESRVVDHLNDLFNPNKKNDLLFFYDYASPQTHPESILEKINGLNKWNSYAFVFSKTFKSSKGLSNTEEELSEANIFRCDKKAGRMQCITCYSNNQVAFTCVSNYSQPGPNRSQPQQGSRGTAQGVESHRYRRGLSIKGTGHRTRNEGGGHNVGWNVNAKWNSRSGRHNGELNLGGGWNHQKGVGRSGGVSVGLSSHHKGGHGGDLNFNSDWEHKKGVSYSSRFSASGQWGKEGRNIIRAE